MTIQVYPEPLDSSENKYAVIVNTTTKFKNAPAIENYQGLTNNPSAPLAPGAYRLYSNNSNLNYFFGENGPITLTSASPLREGYVLNTANNTFTVAVNNLNRNVGAVNTGADGYGQAVYGNGIAIFSGIQVSSREGVFVSTAFASYSYASVSTANGGWDTSDLVYDNGYFVAPTNGSPKTFTHSTDGTNWTYATDPGGTTPIKYTAAYSTANNTWYGGGAANVLYTSTDLLVWSTATNPFQTVTGTTNKNIYRLRKENNRLFAMSILHTAVSGLIYTTDGVNWVDASPGTSGQTGDIPYDIAYINNRYVLATEDSGIAISTDLTNWSWFQNASTAIRYRVMVKSDEGIIIGGGPSDNVKGHLFTNDGVNFSTIEPYISTANTTSAQAALINGLYLASTPEGRVWHLQWLEDLADMTNLGPAWEFRTAAALNDAAIITRTVNAQGDVAGNHSGYVEKVADLSIQDSSLL